jgi:hypothetical protein
VQSEHKQGEKRDKKQPVPSCPMWKEALTALSMYDSAVRFIDVDECCKTYGYSAKVCFQDVKGIS